MEVFREFLTARGQSAGFFESAYTAPNGIWLAVGNAVEGQGPAGLLSQLIAAPEDDGHDTVGA